MMLGVCVFLLVCVCYWCLYVCCVVIICVVYYGFGFVLLFTCGFVWVVVVLLLVLLFGLLVAYCFNVLGVWFALCRLGKWICCV